MTEEEILLLKQSVDLMISQISGSIPSQKEEPQRKIQRDIVAKYLNLSSKLDELKPVKDVQAK